MNKFLIISLLLFTVFHSEAQLITNASATPSAVVQNVLLGSNVTISNVKFNGQNVPNNALGSFTAYNTNLGIDEGIVLTTGTVLNNGAGPHGPNNSANSGIDNGTPGYSILTGLLANPSNGTYNASVLEFDFETCSDSVRFNYVFGSEEYPEYVNAGFNDVFGFFISGPGISGLQNIARLPDGSPVAIDNVHAAGTNVNGTAYPPRFPQLYVNNNGGQTIQYDGFTRLLTAKAKIQCNATYHIIIAIADVGDGIFDSGIFLQGKSFSATEPVEGKFTISQDVFNDPTIMAESCVSTTFTMERTPCNLSAPMTVNFSTSGTATEGVDYSAFPNSITFAPGALTADFTIQAFADGIPEGIENILVDYSYVDNCGNPQSGTLELFINDVSEVEVLVEGNETTCPGEEVEIIATPSGGGAPYTYLWSTGETTPSIFVSPMTTETYSVSVTDDCLNETVTVNYTVVVPDYPPIVIDITDDIVEICPYLPTDLIATATGGIGNLSYQWSSSSGQTLGTDTLQHVIPPTTTTYYVEVSDECGLSATEEVLYTITSPPLVVEISPGIEVCPGDSAHITTSVTGGYGDYYYVWPHSGETTPDVWVNPLNTTSYTVSVSDECQTFTVEATTTITVVQPIADFQVSSHTVFDDLPITFQNLTTGGYSYEWDFGDGQNSTLVHPNNTYDDPGVYYVTLIATNEIGCKDTIQKPVKIYEAYYIYVPNTFTPDGDRTNSVFSASVFGISALNVQIYNRWGEQVFTSDDRNFEWDGTYQGVICPDGTYTYKIKYLSNSGFENFLVGHVNLLK